ncbi:competence/damage-inducible protein A [Gordonia sp. (in: high G+C Gram-positive bacteria)]|uniref:competence/damage-inducible protein A n=1 Tax=Gordonia sp. (in: high G+C Gram-positive bacteria) TaxID=84139 RepID=UPI0016917041|nr:competence/damage-inducible protein A [Gordonia sp. (in: high G+C Gram-positive bacteria)]NLG45357.1 competence/damage-inducible protein A [Gordonia sp. (in: high G+C Gram-positive bacteria)]
MSTRAGIVVTGTEVLSGRIADRNGPWVADQLLQLGVDVAHITICGDRPADLAAQLQFLADQRVDLIITTGGLGPTADDLTVAAVGEFTGRALHPDLEIRTVIESVIRNWRKYHDDLPPSVVAAIDKQALIPEGAQAIPPTGTAPGVAVPATDGMPAILVLPGPPHEVQTMWPAAISSDAVVAAIAGRGVYDQRTLRAYGLSEADLAVSLRAAEKSIDGFDELEITTCMSGGELEIVTRFDVAATPAYRSLEQAILASHGDRVYSTDGATIDAVLAELLGDRTIGTAESCTGGMVAAALTDRPGSSSYMLGGIVSYANEVKSGVLGVPSELIEELGAVSEPVAKAMAEGARHVLGADIAVSTTGIAGPGGARPGKPVGTVCFGLAIDGRDTVTTTRTLPGDRATVRRLATSTALHMVERALRGAV